MKLPCNVVRDLLPLYAEKLTEDETRKLLDEHLADCEECRRKLAELDTKTVSPVDATRPLRTLKREIGRRRWYAVLIAALCVFVVVYTWFYHANEWLLLPWEDGLITVQGVEERPYEEVYGHTAPSAENQGSAVKVLVLRVDSRINGTQESMFRDVDGSQTVLLQGWTTQGGAPDGVKPVGDYHEQELCPVPDRLIYDGGETQQLVWGEPLNGGVQILPRLAMGYYVLAALALAAVSGLVWLVLRGSGRSWIVRQIFFAPVAYLLAHVLIKGGRTASDFLGHELISILLLTAALYALLTLAWQVFLRHIRNA